MFKKLAYVSLLVLSVTACASKDDPKVAEPKPEAEKPLVGEASRTKNANASIDYRRNYNQVLANKALIAIQTVNGEQAGNWSRGERAMTLTLNGHTYDMNDRIDITALPDGLLERQYEAKGKKLKVNVGKENEILDTYQKGTMYIYQQPYSVVIATLPTEDKFGDKSDPDGRLGKASTFQVQLISGLPTKETVINSLTDTVTYKGQAFANFGKGKETGELTYDINFATKKGKGEITGIDSTGKIELAEGRIGSGAKFNPLATERPKGISGSANAEKMDAYNYHLSIFGPNADEVAGYVYGRKQGKQGNWNVGFGGAKPEAQKP